MTAAVRYFRPIGRAFTLSAGLATTYGSQGYTSTYFGVDGRDAAKTGLSKFKADAGFRDVRMNVSGIVSFSPHWHLGAGVIYSRLIGDAADSPVVEDRGSPDQFYGFVGLAYAW